MNNWIDNMIDVIGDDVTVDVIKFIKDNRNVISRLGSDGFRQILEMIKVGKESDARIMLLKSMDNWELIDVMNQTAEALIASAKFKIEFNQFLLDLFVQIGKSVATKLLFFFLSQIRG